jgi:Glycosyl-hydrolase 97 C-terminal, oligomerisation
VTIPFIRNLACRKGETWFVGAMTNWTPRELTIDFSFLKPGNYHAEIFRDGINTDRDATASQKIHPKPSKKPSKILRTLLLEKPVLLTIFGRIILTPQVGVKSLYLSFVC